MNQLEQFIYNFGSLKRRDKISASYLREITDLYLKCESIDKNVCLTTGKLLLDLWSKKRPVRVNIFEKIISIDGINKEYLFKIIGEYKENKLIRLYAAEYLLKRYSNFLDVLPAYTYISRWEKPDSSPSPQLVQNLYSIIQNNNPIPIFENMFKDSQNFYKNSNGYWFSGVDHIIQNLFMEQFLDWIDNKLSQPNISQMDLEIILVWLKGNSRNSFLNFAMNFINNYPVCTKQMTLDVLYDFSFEIRIPFYRKILNSNETTLIHPVLNDILYKNKINLFQKEINIIKRKLFKNYEFGNILNKEILEFFLPIKISSRKRSLIKILKNISPQSVSASNLILDELDKIWDQEIENQLKKYFTKIMKLGMKKQEQNWEKLNKSIYYNHFIYFYRPMIVMINTSKVLMSHSRSKEILILIYKTFKQFDNNFTTYSDGHTQKFERKEFFEIKAAIHKMEEIMKETGEEIAKFNMASQRSLSS